MKNIIKSILLISIFLAQSCSIFQETECEKAFTEEMNERCLKVIYDFANNPSLVYSADTIIHDIRYAISSESIIDVDMDQFYRIQRVFNILNKNEYDIEEPFFKYYKYSDGDIDCSIIYPINTKNDKLYVGFSFIKLVLQNDITIISLDNCMINKHN